MISPFLIFLIIFLIGLFLLLFYYEKTIGKDNKKYFHEKTIFTFSEDLILIYFIISIVFLFSYLYYHNFVKVKKEENFKVFLTFVSTIFAVIFSSAILVQAISFNNSQKNEIITNYNNLSEKFFDEIIKYFSENPDMNYYYNDLFDIEPINNNVNRNFEKEHQISMLIFSKMAKFAVYVEKSNNVESKRMVEDWLGHIFQTFMKSPTLRYYWINYYKPDFSGPASRKYMEFYYKI